VLFFLLPSVFRHAHAAACLAAILAEGAVRTGVLLKRGLFIHTFPVYATDGWKLRESEDEKMSFFGTPQLPNFFQI
jgi:hypothetical protein